MKKIISLIITAVMIVSAFSVCVFAAEGSHKLTVTSKQGLFKSFAVKLSADEAFNIKLELKTPKQLSDCTISTTYNKAQVRVGSYSTTKNLPEPLTNETDDGEYIFVMSTGAKLVDTTAGGEFITLKAKTLSGFSSDQTLMIDLQTLRGGRYKSGSESVDPDFEELYVAWSKVEDSNFTFSASIPDKESAEPSTQATNETTKPAETTKPVETAKPAETTKPVETTKPAETTKPVETTKEPAESSTAAPTGSQLIYGDSNQDNSISIKDATLIQEHLAKLKTLTGNALAVSDVDGDGNISIKDATCIQKYLAKLEGAGKVGEKF